MRVVVVLLALFLGTAAQAQAATTRYAVPGGGTGDASCKSVAAGCSLTEVLENVVASGDEVVVLHGTHDLGSTGVYIHNGPVGLNIHGEDGHPRPTITAATSGASFQTCNPAPCSGAGTILRHLAIKNTNTGSALDFWGGAVGNPITVEAATVLPANSSAQRLR